MDDDFDRLIRSQLHFNHCLSYIISNPRHLPPTDYTLYIKPDLMESTIMEGTISERTTVSAS